MTEVKNLQVKPEIKSNASSPTQALEKIRIKKRQRPVENRRGRHDRSRGRKEKHEELDSRIISIRRVTRVYKGGKRMRLSVVLVAGDKKGRVGMGVGKGADVKAAEGKAMAYAKKHLVMIEKRGDTIPYELFHKKGAAKIFLRPAAPGTGIIAGSAIRAVVELAGIKDILSKVIGSRSSINNAYATLEALSLLRGTRL
ncbi:MAG: 30S ribosomal protein S5 [candidate division WS6 bacterium GW2011_GWA2_37_6]|uniref:Small ribosomal subunit protein uS5 n=1 Tax=candidate division WS6 bacterium GW2011_GWA2_37_6 TaxID=1619087 RepID=A0A0G0GY45_9BACT|nr:MAG: 30S ribosomal protein S5 [candidate division WS6 bacterium GW2011_GWA2_37_6]